MTQTQPSFFLENIDKDVLVPLEGRYFLKRYAYHAHNFIDAKGQRINERVFSFILLHGKRWDNSTHFNVCESEMHTVYELCNAHLSRIKAERADLLLNERKERKQFPKITNIKFKNVTISAVESMAYTNSSYSVTGYPLLGEKIIELYANGKPFRSGTFHVKQEFEVTETWILKQTGRLYTARYNVSDLSGKKTYVSDVTINRKKLSYVPYHFYIGYALKYKNETYSIYDIRYSNFDEADTIFFQTDKGNELVIPQADMFNIEVVGELTGMQAFSALKNKLKYME